MIAEGMGLSEYNDLYDFIHRYRLKLGEKK